MKVRSLLTLEEKEWRQWRTSWSFRKQYSFGSNFWISITNIGQKIIKVCSCIWIVLTVHIAYIMYSKTQQCSGFCSDNPCFTWLQSRVIGSVSQISVHLYLFHFFDSWLKYCLTETDFLLWLYTQHIFSSHFWDCQKSIESCSWTQSSLFSVDTQKYHSLFTVSKWMSASFYWQKNGCGTPLLHPPYLEWS